MLSDEEVGQICLAAVSIALEPASYKLCVGCERIVPEKLRVCSCGGYNFSKAVIPRLLDVIAELPVLAEQCQKIISERNDYENKNKQNTKNN